MPPGSTTPPAALPVRQRLRPQPNPGESISTATSGVRGGGFTTAPRVQKMESGGAV